MRSGTDGAPSFVFVPGLASAGGELAIGGEEARYLRRVVRVRAGERVTATDGEGTLAELVVLEAGDEVRTGVAALRTVARPLALEAWCGAPEGDRADWLVEKLGELGVATLRLVDCERGRWERAAQKSGRWDRLAVAALRQSRSAHRLRVEPPVPLAGLLEGEPGFAAAWLADPDGGSFAPASPEAGKLFAAAIGPSGGFSDAECKLLRGRGFVPVRLTRSRLRTETAAVALASLVLSSAG
jgi:16S rRNA (uracil1498-N3)-methyltransferase